MKKSSLLTMICVFAMSGGLASRAHAEMKVGTIDMQKVFTAYYKTHDAEDKLKEAQKALHASFCVGSGCNFSLHAYRDQLALAGPRT